MTVSAPPPSSTIVPLAPGKPAGATPQSGWRPSGFGPGETALPSTIRPQPRSKQRSDSRTSDQDVAAPATVAGMPAPQLESDFPAAAFSAVLHDFSQAQSAVDVSTKSSQRLSAAPLTQRSPIASAAFVSPVSIAAHTPIVALASIVGHAPLVRADNISPKTTTAKSTTAKSTSPQTTTRVPIPGPEGLKPSLPGTAAPVREPRPREAPSLHPAGFEPPATSYPGAGIHAGTDGGRDVPAPESEPGKVPSGFQKAAPPAPETPAGGAVTSPAASGPHPLAFAARLVEQPAAVIAGDNPAQDPKSQTQTSAEAAAPPKIALPVSSGAATQSTPRTPPSLLPEDPTEPAPPLLPQPSKPEDAHTSNTSGEVPASVPRREDTDNPSSQSKVVRPESVENLQTASPHGPAATASAPVAGFEELPTPGRADPSGPVNQGRVTDSAQTTAQVLAGGDSAPREATAGSPAQNISVRLSSDGHPALEVRVMERGGEVRVAVHSPDPATSESVRAGLPELVDRLGQRGYETEIWRPPTAPSSARAQGESGSSFDRSGQQDPRQQRHPQRQPQPAWLEELDGNLNPNTNRSAFSWRP